MKQRNQQYKLNQMSPGDRFYFAGDRSKKVFTLDNREPFFHKIQAGFHKWYANTIPDSAPLTIEHHASNRRVIFLRNVNEITT